VPRPPDDPAGPPDDPAARAWTDLSRPPLRPSAATRVLAGSQLWRELTVVATTGSTNQDLADRARTEDPAEGVVLSADHQQSGRGRLDREWSAPPRSGLAVSVLLTPREVDPARWSWLPLLTGLAVVDVLQTVAGLPARLKWPNDVLVEERKVSGILAEVVATRSGSAVVVGVGLNVSLRSDELPVPTATSLYLAGSASTDREVLLRAYLRALEHRYSRWRTALGDPRVSGIGAAYRENCATIGRAVRMELPNGQVVEGAADGVDDEGRLLVTDARGHTHPLAAGDVRHVR
jgi:BirA family transcriptional regulator, biotin operon repressor / biotin---[acetyl-CoA-carboxylase] ligase